ncbi:PLDc N-terminal domain-containing protein [Pseudomonas syringae]|uniref:PLDc N-terminal domain-containing protein n=1 Tax=Pseudomonas syringae TaxID=317 RepID=UPI00031A22E5
MGWISENHLWLFTTLTALIVISDIWAVLRIRKSKTQSSNKLMWIIVVVAVPIVGVLALLIAGPRHVDTPARPEQQSTKY